MKIQVRQVKSIFTKSMIPGVDFVINPFVGCQHGCIYCYAEFMKRFTNHGGDQWGKFLDIKLLDFNRIKPHKYDGKSLLLSSVTDPYLPLELKYQNTRKILEKLICTTASITILTKSKLMVRDIDLFKKFKNIEIGISISTLNEKISKIIEPIASNPLERLNALREVHEQGLKTFVFISPLFPVITNYQKIINESKKFTTYYMFENLNFRPHNIPRIFKFIKEQFPELLKLYKQFKNNPDQWDLIERDIERFCQSNDLRFSIEFHHGGFSKS